MIVTQRAPATAHTDGMETIDALFAPLLDREAAHLTADERESLEYFYAALNLSEELPADTAARRWCEMATTLGRISHMLGRMPRSGDPGTNPQILRWVAAQKDQPLNSYQRARLRGMPGGTALLR